MPSLWYAAAGDRPVPKGHDDPGHITWGRKNDLLEKKKWFYAKFLHRNSTIISLRLIPYFFSPSQGVLEGLKEFKNFIRWHERDLHKVINSLITMAKSFTPSLMEVREKTFLQFRN